MRAVSNQNLIREGPGTTGNYTATGYSRPDSGRSLRSLRAVASFPGSRRPLGSGRLPAAGGGARFAAVLPLLLLTAQQNPVVHYIRTQLLDRTFTVGPANLPLYQANGFDMALLIPYFAVLAVLAFYGFHRYSLVFLYYRHRKQRAQGPGGRFAPEAMPFVTVQLPIYNEQYVVERLVESICK